MQNQLLGAESNHELSRLQNAPIVRSHAQADAILDETRRRLSASGFEELRLLVCEYHEGMLILRGRLSSHYMKQLAQETVRTQTGVNLILNATDVVSPSWMDIARN